MILYMLLALTRVCRKIVKFTSKHQFIKIIFKKSVLFIFFLNSHLIAELLLYDQKTKNLLYPVVLSPNIKAQFVIFVVLSDLFNSILQGKNFI